MRIGLSYHGGDHDYEAYPAALRRRAQALGVPIEIEWLAGALLPAQPDALARIDALVLTGGPDVEPRRYGMPESADLCKTNPERDAAEWAMLERLRERPIPTLAICRGAQLLNVFHGGTLIADLAEGSRVHTRTGEEWRLHEVTIEGGTRLHEIAGVLRGVVNSSHHQAVDRLADGFRVAAAHGDVIEAFEPAGSTEPFKLAVQWHPEAMEAGLPLADGIIDALLRTKH
jgi:putative glutamine amidotransferase